jgi:protein-disulfide isomerase
MASRTQQKEQARQARIAADKARAEGERRKRRTRMIGGVVLAAVIVVAVAVAVSVSSSSGGGGLKTGTQASSTVNSVDQLLAGIPQSGAVLGNPNAPVTMTYYGDLQCPVCRDFTLQGGLSQLIQNEVKEGKVKIEYRAFETATTDPQVFEQQHIAALAAGLQNKFWQYVELFYHQQGAEGSGYVTPAFLTGIANQVTGLNVSQWQNARTEQSLLTHVESNEAAGTKAGVTGTPTLVFTGPKGQASPSVAVPSYSDLQSAISQVS